MRTPVLTLVCQPNADRVWKRCNIITISDAAQSEHWLWDRFSPHSPAWPSTWSSCLKTPECLERRCANMPHSIYFRVFFVMKTTECHGSAVNSNPAPSEAEDGIWGLMNAKQVFSLSTELQPQAWDKELLILKTQWRLRTEKWSVQPRTTFLFVSLQCNPDVCRFLFYSTSSQGPGEPHHRAPDKLTTRTLTASSPQGETWPWRKWSKSMPLAWTMDRAATSVGS